MVASTHAGQLFTVLLMALALGMDAFSLGIGMGMKGIRLLNILKTGILVGVFHFLMPLMGMFAGHYMGSLLGNVATSIGGGLLILLGVHMVYSSLTEEEDRMIGAPNTNWGLFIFALMVSIDSFPVGISLGILSSDLLLTILIFGWFGGTMSILGLVIGRRFGSWIGDYGETIGGVILVVFGIRFLI